MACRMRGLPLPTCRRSDHEPAHINLDKLRNIVQKFGSHSFTTSQVATDYLQGDNASALEAHQFEDLLKRHAALLAIRPLPSSAGGDTVWVSAM
jgi:hypothetical protein